MVNPYKCVTSLFCFIYEIIQRSPLFCASIVKKGPGRARQNSRAAAGTNFTKPGAQNKGDLCRVEQKDPTWLVNKSPLQADLLPRSVGRSKEEEFNYRGIVLYYTILSF